MVNLRFVLAQSIKLTLAVVTLSLLGFTIWAIWQPEEALKSDRSTFTVHESPVTLPSGTEYSDRDGKRRRYAEDWASGDVWIVNFWAAWCGPCVREMPFLHSLLQQYGKDGLQIMAINQDTPEGGLPAAHRLVDAFYANYGLEGWEPRFYEMDAKGDFRMIGLPTTLVIGRDGKEYGRMTGAFRPDDETRLIALIETLLAAPRPGRAPEKAPVP